MTRSLKVDQRAIRIAVIRTCVTQREAARRLGVTESGLSQWLARERLNAKDLLLEPPQAARPADHYTERGARKLARAIEDYWEAKGGIVRCHIVRSGTMARAGFWHYDVRSDMINGKPRRMRGDEQ